MKIYQLTGHQEQDLGGNFTDALTKNNITVEDLSLVTMESVPEDAAALIICSPQKDFSSEETEKILNYLQNGGKVLLFTDYTVDEMENLGRVLENYGLKKDSGIVMEGDANNYTQLGPNAFLPEISTESAYASSLSADAYVLVQNAQAIREIES